MAITLSDLFTELAQYSALHNQPMLAHIARMGALEAQGKNILAPMFGWTIVGMWDWDAVNDITYLEPGCAELFSVDPHRAVKGLPINDYLEAVHHDDSERLVDAIMSTLKSGGPFEVRYRVISNGRARNIIARGVCTLDESGRAIRFPGVILEVANQLTS